MTCDVMLVCKSRIQNPEHPAYDGYMLIDAQHNYVVSGADSYDYSLSLGDLEAELGDFLSLNAGGCEPRKLAA